MIKPSPARHACIVAILVSAGGTLIGARIHSAAMQTADESTVAGLIAQLQADGSNEAVRTELRRLVSREPPPPTAVYERIREAFRAAARVAAETLDPPGEPGPVMHVEGRVTDESGRPVAGALVYVFHADSTGWYARRGEMDERHPRLFAYLRTDSEGRYSFRTARPGGYQKQYGGRYIPQHIHFEVAAAGRTTRRFQLVFSDDPRMDDYWTNWAQRLYHPIADVVRRNGTQHCVVNITLPGEQVF
jgi:protocatechuate 3,4-dioxygenase beta subunit